MDGKPVRIGEFYYNKEFEPTMIIDIILPDSSHPSADYVDNDIGFEYYPTLLSNYKSAFHDIICERGEAYERYDFAKNFFVEI